MHDLWYKRFFLVVIFVAVVCQVLEVGRGGITGSYKVHWENPSCLQIMGMGCCLQDYELCHTKAGLSYWNVHIVYSPLLCCGLKDISTMLPDIVGQFVRPHT